MALTQLAMNNDGSVVRRGGDLNVLWRKEYSHSESRWIDLPYAEIVDNVPFEATLEFTCMHSTNNSYYAEFLNAETGASYPMFFADFVPLVKEMYKGLVHGTWHFYKHGAYVGIRRVETKSSR